VLWQHPRDGALLSLSCSCSCSFLNSNSLLRVLASPPGDSRKAEDGGGKDDCAVLLDLE